MGAAWVEILNERVALASVGSPFVDKFAAEGTGLDVRQRKAAVFAELERLADEAVAAGARTLILGGGAFAGLGRGLKPMRLRSIAWKQRCELRWPLTPAESRTPPIGDERLKAPKRRARSSGPRRDDIGYLPRAISRAIHRQPQSRLAS